MMTHRECLANICEERENTISARDFSTRTLAELITKIDTQFETKQPWSIIKAECFKHVDNFPSDDLQEPFLYKVVDKVEKVKTLLDTQGESLCNQIANDDPHFQKYLIKNLGKGVFLQAIGGKSFLQIESGIKLGS